MDMLNQPLFCVFLTLLTIKLVVPGIVLSWIVVFAPLMAIVGIYAVLIILSMFLRLGKKYGQQRVDKTE